MKKFSIFEQLCFSTIRLQTYNNIGQSFCGSGFFYNLQMDEKTIIPLIVTNKHVVRGMTKGLFRFTKADADGNPIHKEHFTINYEDNFEKSWYFHPDANVDLCVLPIQPLLNNAEERKIRLFYRCFDDSLIPTKEIIESLDVMEDIIMIGYPNGLWDSINNIPIVRQGITATPYRIDYEDRKEFMIDAACFPGSSGSPVFICNIGSVRDKFGNVRFGTSRVLLLGILYAGPQLTISGDVKIVTVPSSQSKLQTIAHIPNNLGYVIKSERILDFKDIFRPIIQA